MITSEIHKYSTTAFIGIDKNNINENLNEKFKNDKNNFYWLFYLLIFGASFGYEYFICNYISEKNEFSLVDWLNTKNESQYKKYRINNDNQFSESNNNDLRQCLL